MNAYSVISETLWETIPILDDGTGPSEPYAIAHVVVAATRAKARWMAWQTDKATWSTDPRDMPKFSVRKLKGDVEGPARIATDEPEYQELWAASAADDPECLRAEIEQLRRERDALLGLVVTPWTREGDGKPLWKVNLAWSDTEETRFEAVLRVYRAAGIPEIPELSEPTPVA
jgi:hypothetical protein